MTKDDAVPARGPLYARVMGLRHVRVGGFASFLLFEGMVAIGVLLALAELVSWWAVPVLPAVVAVMVKVNDMVAGGARQAAGRVSRAATYDDVSGSGARDDVRASTGTGTTYGTARAVPTEERTSVGSGRRSRSGGVRHGERVDAGRGGRPRQAASGAQASGARASGAQASGAQASAAQASDGGGASRRSAGVFRIAVPARASSTARHESPTAGRVDDAHEDRGVAGRQEQRDEWHEEYADQVDDQTGQHHLPAEESRFVARGSAPVIRARHAEQSQPVNGDSYTTSESRYEELRRYREDSRNTLNQGRFA